MQEHRTNEDALGQFDSLSNYRSSSYNITVELNATTTLLFNTLSGAVALIPTADVPRIQELIANPEDVAARGLIATSEVTAAVDGGFVVPKELSELSLLKTRSLLGRFSSEEFALTIMPTLDCNFRCAYCYENRDSAPMSDQTESCLLAWIDAKLLAAKRFRIDWFGGEPLLALDRIGTISRSVMKLCERRSIYYSSTLTTNGYLLKADTHELLSVCRIGRIQITLDGPADIHDRMRPLAGGAPTFAVLIKNIEMLLQGQPGIQMIIRINCSQQTVDRAYQLLEELPSAITTRATIYATEIYGCDADGMICGMENPTSEHRDCSAQRKLFRKRLLDFNLHALSKRSEVDASSVLSYILSPKSGYCEAAFSNRFVVDPLGRVFKCTVKISPRDAVGRIVPPGMLEFNMSNYSTWLARDAFENSQCRTCSALPLCLGGCMNSRASMSGECATPVSPDLLTHAIRGFYRMKTERDCQLGCSGAVSTETQNHVD